jgi:hypothetical protein
VVHARPSPEALIEQGQFRRERTMVEARFAQNPNDPETLYLMSWIKEGRAIRRLRSNWQSARWRQAEAVAEYRTAVKMDANSPVKAELKRLKA